MWMPRGRITSTCSIIKWRRLREMWHWVHYTFITVDLETSTHVVLLIFRSWVQGHVGTDWVKGLVHTKLKINYLLALMLMKSFVDHRVFLEQTSKTETQQSSPKLKYIYIYIYICMIFTLNTQWNLCPGLRNLTHIFIGMELSRWQLDFRCWVNLSFNISVLPLCLCHCVWRGESRVSLGLASEKLRASSPFRAKAPLRESID